MNKKTKQKIRTVSLFSGCGGGDLGLLGGFKFLGKKFRKLGFDIIWSNEIDPFAAETYRKNFRKEITNGDIAEIKAKEIPDHDLLMGGFPCQPFSMVGGRKGFSDKRGKLYLHIVRVLKAKKPAAFIAENVKGLLSVEKGKLSEKILSDFEKAHYEVSHAVLNAALYGVPQKRERLFIVGVRKDRQIKFQFPGPSGEIIPLGRVIEDHGKVGPKYYFSKKALAGLKKANKAFNKGRVQALNFPCNTISTHLAKVSLNGTDPVLLMKKNRYRRLTPREAARIQSFPESFVFEGSEGKQYIQIGNAIPPVLMWHLAKAVKEQVFNGRRIYSPKKKRDNVSNSVKRYEHREAGILGVA